MELGLVERQAPYDPETGRPVEGGRRAFYRLCDPFLSMWYACVRPHLSGLNLRAPTVQQRALGAWSHHVASVWEDLCRQQWHRLRHQGVEWEPAGRFWSGREPNAEEWDVISVSADRRLLFLGECKWVRNPRAGRLEAIVREIKRRAAMWPSGNAGRMEIILGLFVPEGTGLPRSLDGVSVLDASRLLRA
jgi:hypothetical protein